MLNQSIKTTNDSFIIHIKTKNVYEDIANDVEKGFDTFNYDNDEKRPLEQERIRN